MRGTQTSGSTDQHVDLDVEQLPGQGMGGPLERRFGLAAARQPHFGLGTVVVVGRIDGQPAVERDRIDPAFDRSATVARP